jgi:hypothetical protein
VSGRARAGERLEASPGTWSGTAPISFAYRWQRCSGSVCRTIPGATGTAYTLAGPDVGERLRVVVLAGNWVSSVSQAVSSSTATVDPAPRSNAAPRGGGGGTAPAGSRRAKLALTRVRMDPRRFPVSHRRPRPGSRPDGARISWRLNRAATVRLRFERAAGRRWVRVGAITRKARAGSSVVRFRGRFGSRLLSPRRYRVVVVASRGGERTAARRLVFRVVKG